MLKVFLISIAKAYSVTEVNTGMKRSHPSQKRYVPLKLKMARSGQGWQRLKMLSILLQLKFEAGARRVKPLVRLSWGHPLSVPAALL